MSKFKVVPMEPTPEMVAALKARLTTTSRGGILNAGHALADAISTAPDVQGEPVAYAAFSSNGNILWCADPFQVETLRQEYGEALQPLYAAPQPAPDVVEALELVMHCNEVGFLPEIVQQAVSDALAAHRKQGGEM